MTKNITEPLVDMRGHGRKVTLLRFNPTANNVLASCSGDMTVKIWDVEKVRKRCGVFLLPGISETLFLTAVLLSLWSGPQGEALNTFTGNQELTQDIVWNYNGDVLATSCKDKQTR